MMIRSAQRVVEVVVVVMVRVVSGGDGYRLVPDSRGGGSRLRQG